MALHEIKNKGIRHEQHVANTSKLETIESFPRKPQLLSLSMRAYAYESFPEKPQLLSLSMRAYAYNPLDFPPVPSLAGHKGVCSIPLEKQLTSRDVRSN